MQEVAGQLGQSVVAQVAVTGTQRGCCGHLDNLRRKRVGGWTLNRRRSYNAQLAPWRHRSRKRCLNSPLKTAVTRNGSGLSNRPNRNTPSFKNVDGPRPVGGAAGPASIAARKNLTAQSRFTQRFPRASKYVVMMGFLTTDARATHTPPRAINRSRQAYQVEPFSDMNGMPPFLHHDPTRKNCEYTHILRIRRREPALRTHVSNSTWSSLVNPLEDRFLGGKITEGNKCRKIAPLKSRGVSALTPLSAIISLYFVSFTMVILKLGCVCRAVCHKRHVRCCL